MAEFKILAFQTPEFKILAHLKILAFQDPEYKILADFKILADQNTEFKILGDIKILAFQNPKFKILADFSFSFPRSWIHDFARFYDFIRPKSGTQHFRFPKSSLQVFWRISRF